MKKTYLIASVVVAVVTLWMLSGVFTSKPHDAHSQTATQAEDTSANGGRVSRVRVTHLVAEPQRVEIVLRGRTEAKRVVDIRAETGGRVVAVPVEKGQQVKAGDILCELAENGRHAQLSQAQAAYDKAVIDYDGALRLKKDGLLSTTSIAASKSALESTRAALKMAQLEVEHLQMHAPFAGFVESRPAEIGVLMDRGAVCARLLDEASLLASGQASEREVAPLVLGQPVMVQLSNGDRVDGNISFISRTADPQTRTYRVEATLDTAGISVRDGITAQITIPLQEVVAHRISPAVLALDDAGKIGVRIINPQKRVEFHLVTVVRETADGVWVTGLPQEINLITVGQELVAEGDLVEASIDNSAVDTSMSSGSIQASKP